MTDLCNDAENTFMQYMFDGTAPATAPTSLSVSLHDSTLDVENPGANSSEISGTGYSRQSHASADWSSFDTSTDSNHNDAAVGYENGVDINFGPFDGSHTIEGFVVWDADNGNALWASTGISTSVSADDELVFNSGDLRLSMD